MKITVHVLNFPQSLRSHLEPKKSIIYHFFLTKIEQLEIKGVAVITDKKLANQFTKGISEHIFRHNSFIFMG